MKETRLISFSQRPSCADRCPSSFLHHCNGMKNSERETWLSNLHRAEKILFLFFSFCDSRVGGWETRWICSQSRSMQCARICFLKKWVTFEKRKAPLLNTDLRRHIILFGGLVFMLLLSMVAPLRRLFCTGVVTYWWRSSLWSTASGAKKNMCRCLSGPVYLTWLGDVLWK